MMLELEGQAFKEKEINAEMKGTSTTFEIVALE